MQSFREEVFNVTGSLAVELRGLGGFLQQYFQLLLTSKVRQTSQLLTVLLEHVRAQLDMLSMGHLSPSIITPIRLREVLLGIQARLLHHLRLPVNPTKPLWKYYSALGCTTLLENKKLLVLVSVPLLNRDSTFEIYQVINKSSYFIS